MYYVAAIVFLLLAVGAWVSVTAPFIRSNREDADPQYAGFLIAIFYDLYVAVVIGVAHKIKLPLGVYAHGVFLVAAIIFGVMGGLRN